MHGSDASSPGERAPSVEIELRPASATAFAALVTLHGGHDIATSRDLRDALASLDGDVLLDLSECEFMDSSVIYAVFSDSHARTQHGHRLELVVPPENRIVTRILEIAGARELLAIHRAGDFDTRNAAPEQ
ncbi:MAG TPA: STAS domain-containing protein [Gaiellales bacterium]